MTVNSKIRQAVTPYVDACVFGAYTGTDETYCYFIFPQDSVALSGDNEAVIDNTSVQLHLFTPNNYLTLKKQIRASLLKNGFSYPNVTCLYETETKLNHIIFECDILSASETEE